VHKTWLQQRHPLVKVVGLMGAVMAALFGANAAGVLLLVAVLLLLLWQSGHPPWRMSGRGFFLALAVSMVLVHAIILREGSPLIGPFTWNGLSGGVRGAGRLIALILAGRLFALTTAPGELAQVLIAMGLPYRWAFALITSIRLEPLFSQQARIVYWAQLTRGVQYRQGPVWRRWFMFRRLLFPLLVYAVRTARDLSGMMESRGFGRHRNRSSMHPIRFGTVDGVALAGWILLCIVLVTAI
jgi:energy-coupling factor transport system permease protein